MLPEQDQAYENGPVPPVGVSVADPLQVPAQGGFVMDAVIVAWGGEVSVPVTVTEQELTSFTVTV